MNVYVMANMAKSIPIITQNIFDMRARSISDVKSWNINITYLNIQPNNPNVIINADTMVIIFVH